MCIILLWSGFPSYFFNITRKYKITKTFNFFVLSYFISRFWYETSRMERCISVSDTLSLFPLILSRRAYEYIPRSITIRQYSSQIVLMRLSVHNHAIPTSKKKKRKMFLWCMSTFCIIMSLVQFVTFINLKWYEQRKYMSINNNF